MAISFPRTFGSVTQIPSTWWDDNFSAINNWITATVGQANGIATLDATSVLNQRTKQMYAANCATVTQSVTQYISVVGETTMTATESKTQYIAPAAATAIALYAQIDGNTFGTALVITLRINGVDSALSVSITASSTAVFSSTGSVTINAGDALSYKVVSGTGAGGALKVSLKFTS